MTDPVKKKTRTAPADPKQERRGQKRPKTRLRRLERLWSGPDHGDKVEGRSLLDQSGEASGSEDPWTIRLGGPAERATERGPEDGLARGSCVDSGSTTI